MEVDCALLCDAVTVREGLLNILGGGITRLNRPSYPTQWNGGLALRILVHPTEGGSPHTIQVLMQDEDGSRLSEIQAAFEQMGTSPDIAPGEQLSLPIAIQFDAAIPAPGAYSFEVLIDGHHKVSVPMRAVVVPEA